MKMKTGIEFRQFEGGEGWGLEYMVVVYSMGAMIGKMGKWVENKLHWLYVKPLLW